MMNLKTLSTVKRGTGGEVRICEDTAGKNKNRYTVIALSDHDKAHDVIAAYEAASYIEEPTYLDMYSEDGDFLIIYPYVPERRIDKFYMGGVLSLRKCEEICVNLIVACMTSNMPWSLLYLVLTQREIQLSQDGQVSLSYAIDMSDFDIQKGEAECVLECAKILIELLAPKADRRANSYILLTKKVEKATYYHFTELYKDLKAAMQPIRKGGIFLRLKVWFERNKDTLFRIILRISIVLALFVIITFLTNLIFGDVPWLRIFIRSFERIGLESLTQ